MREWRLLDPGPHAAAENMALDRILLEGCAGGTSPPTLRFVRMRPAAVLVGAFQNVEDEVRQEYCRERDIHVSRRITGGGAIYFDEGQLGWEVVCRWRDVGTSAPGEGLFERLCRPVVDVLRDLGMRASFRPRNDIEVRGRKISGTGGTDQDGAMLFQGTLLVDFDVETMVRALRVPVEKLRRREIEMMADRVTWISRETGARPDMQDLIARISRRFEESLDVRLVRGELTEGEKDALARTLPVTRSGEYVRGGRTRRTELVRALLPTPGGMLRPVIKCDERRSRIEAVVLGGDFFAFPARGVMDLEARLKGERVERVPDLVRAFFDEGRVSIPGVTAGHVVEAMGEALARRDLEDLGLTVEQANATFAVGGDLADVARLGPTHLLLPYCAKPVDCENRGRDSCDRCGSCAVGTGYEMGESANLEVHTVTSYEHLMSTLRSLKERGAPAFLGSCCEAFYVKHRRDLEEVGLPGILIDVAGSESCYDLGKSAVAYRGEFEGRSEVDVGLLGALLSMCEARS